MGNPLFIACADLHLSEKPPVFRSAEPDWLVAQARQLDWLFHLATKYCCPVVVAGDLFDKAIGTTLLANVVTDLFPCPSCVFSVAGNHDLSFRNLDQIQYTSYGSLIRANRIKDVCGREEFTNSGINVVLHGFPYGSVLKPCEKRGDVDVAVIHKFVCSGRPRKPFVSFPEDCHLKNVLAKMSGYDYYVFGDNHSGFIDGKVVNCGAFYRRARNFADYKPFVSVFYQDHIEQIFVPVDEDVDTANGKVVPRNESNCDFSGFIESLRSSENLTCDVDELLKQYLAMNRVPADVYAAIESLTGIC